MAEHRRKNYGVSPNHPETLPPNLGVVFAARQPLRAFTLACPTFNRRTVHRAVLSRLGGPLLALAVLTIAPIPQAHSQRADARPPYITAAPDAAAVPSNFTVASVQSALMWTGHYGAMIDGSFGAYTKRAITDWQSQRGYQGTGQLTAQQAEQLIAEGTREREAVGWAILYDETVGYSVGVPTALTKFDAPERKGNLWGVKAKGAIEYMIAILDYSPGCAAQDALFTEMVNSSGKVDYKAKSNDWFVISGEDESKKAKYYTRSVCRPQGLVTVAVWVPTGLVDRLHVLFAAMSNSLEVRSSLNLKAQPTPRIIALPSQSVSVQPPAAQQAPPSVAGTPPRPALAGVDRTGKSAGIRLVLQDGTEMKPREVFQRVAPAVFVVMTNDSQGSAVAISDSELLTNCHVLGNAGWAEIQQEGARSRANLVSANPEEDRCILRSETPLRSWVRVRPYADIKVGERAFTIGAPQGMELTIAEGIVSSKRVLDGTRIVQTSAPISKGSSGGGLFDAQGYLLGITTWMRKDAQNLNFAIAAEEYAK